MTTSARATRLRNAVLGVVALAVLVGSIAITYGFLRGGFTSGVPISALFSEPGVGQQLPIGGDVKVRGVLVGRISSIELRSDGLAEVRLHLTDPFPNDSSVDVRSKTVFGQKWIELIPGDSSQVFATGDVIPDERTKEPLELERALQKGHDLLSVIPAEDLALI